MAKGMNRFSGVPLTPAALAFPMRERQWRAGELSRLTDRIREWEKQIELGKARIQELREQLKALDMVIGLHPIKIDPTTLPPVRKERAPDLALRAAIAGNHRGAATPAANTRHHG